MVSEPKVGEHQVHGDVGVSSISLSSMEATIVSDMEKLNGANFALWKSQMEDILILKDQYLPIEGVAKKPSLMIVEDWNKLDRKAIAIAR